MNTEQAKFFRNSASTLIYKCVSWNNAILECKIIHRCASSLVSQAGQNDLRVESWRKKILCGHEEHPSGCQATMGLWWEMLCWQSLAPMGQQSKNSSMRKTLRKGSLRWSSECPVCPCGPRHRFHWAKELLLVLAASWLGAEMPCLAEVGAVLNESCFLVLLD